MSMSQHNSMELSQSMEQRQVLSPKMIQSMELLQLPLALLDQRIEEEIEQNPVLDCVEDYADTASESDMDGSNETDFVSGDTPVSDENSQYEKEEPIQISDEGNNENDFTTADEFAQVYYDTIDEAPPRSQSRLEEIGETHDDILNNFTAHEETLEDYLLEQLSFDLAPELRQFCERIILALDDNGRLTEPLDDLMKDKTDKEERELAKKALRIVQSCVPKGVGARNIKECFTLQIPPHFSQKAKNELRTLIENHLEDLSQNRIPHISKVTGFSFEKIKDYRLEIMGMNPWPGTNFGKNKAHAIRPDVLVQRREDGTWDIQIVNGRGGRLRISPYYLDLARRKKLEPDAKEFLRKNIASAKWLIEALGQRKSTLERVVDQIVIHQREFFELGPEHIKPLKLKQIAQRLNVDVSTVSRAYRDKWMQTPQGLFPLKRFFSGALTQEKKSDQGNETEETIAQAAVLQKVQAIVAAEDKKNPLSDEEIVVILNRDGIEISRRTVAKYRGILGIPGSRGRRSWD